MANVWTEEKIQFLKENFTKENKEMLCEKFGVKWNQIRKIANQNGFRLRNFRDSDEDVQFLRENYSPENKDMICKKLGIKWDSVKHMASRHKIVMPYRWTQEMLDYVKNNYHQDKKEDLLKFTGKSWDDIRHIAMKLGVKIVKTSNIDWTQSEIDYLKNNYTPEKRDELLEHLPGRTIESIYGKVHQLGIKINTEDRKSSLCKNHVEKLLEDTPESFYWIGYILADGSFFKNHSLKICLSNKDKEQMLNLGKLINSDVIDNTNRPMCTINASDRYNIPKILEKFDIKPRKTYNPPDPKHYDQFSDELIFWLFVGYIDGDGSISYSYNKKSGVINIVCHESWYNFICYLVNRVAKMLNEEPVKTIHKTKEKWVRGHISRLPICHKIKKKIEESGLPVLNRKWDRIKSNFVPRYIKEQQKRAKVISLINMGKTNKEIMETEKVSLSMVTCTRKSLDNPTPNQ